MRLQFLGVELPGVLEVPLLVDQDVPILCLSVGQVTQLHIGQLRGMLKHGNWRRGLILNFHTLNHGVIPVPMTQTDWVPLEKTPEEILIRSQPERFRMIRELPDTTNQWRLSDQELDAMRIYQVMKGQSSADE